MLYHLFLIGLAYIPDVERYIPDVNRFIPDVERYIPDASLFITALYS
ncbi:hypothetical protein [Mesobacillus foraminis]|nr:hypothetical protein [Mesobacillus foraminis]